MTYTIKLHTTEWKPIWFGLDNQQNFWSTKVYANAFDDVDTPEALLHLFDGLLNMN